MFIDTHAHLSDAYFDKDRDVTIRRAATAGVGAMVEIADQEKDWGKARTLAEKNPGRIYWSAGFHPHYADKADADLAKRLKEAVAHPQCLAVGEIGLDYYQNTVDPKIQQKVFTELLQAAVEAGKPVVLHCRESDPSAVAAHTDMLRIIKQTLPQNLLSQNPRTFNGVAHCFQGPMDAARLFIRMGFCIGVDGPVTYPNADALRAVMAEIPLDYLVLETDSPYLPPQTRRGQRNEPAAIVSIASSLAELKCISIRQIEAETTKNAEKLFRTSFQKKA